VFQLVKRNQTSRSVGNLTKNRHHYFERTYRRRERCAEPRYKLLDNKIYPRYSSIFQAKILQLVQFGNFYFRCLAYFRAECSRGRNFFTSSRKVGVFDFP